jgi:hypothetical protein
MYCTYGCVIAATIEHGDSVLLQRRMLRDFYGRDQEVQCDFGGHGADRRLVDAFVPAPPRTALAKFGGHMSIEEFRGCSLRGVKVTQVRVPLIPIVPGFEEEFISRWSVYHMGLFQGRVFDVNDMAETNNSKMNSNKGGATRAPRKRTKRTTTQEIAPPASFYENAKSIDDQIRIAKEEAEKTEIKLFGEILPSSGPTSPARRANKPGILALSETPVMGSPPGVSPKKKSLFDYMKRS